jgi:glyoxylase-like metal-dependent hydrolase (beta-lactamase superfamily II)
MDWTASGAEAVAPGVHRLALPLPMDGLRAVNVYALVGPAGVTLVDGGWNVPEARAALELALRSLDVSVDDVGRCLVTHHHRDHYTLAVGLRRETGLRVGIGAGEKDNIRVARQVKEPFAAQRGQLERAGAGDLLGWLDLAPRDMSALLDYEDPDEWLRDGQVLDLVDRALRVRATPGHTTGHVVFSDDDAGLLFAGDHVLPRITPSIGFQATVPALPLADYLSSLAVLLGEPDRMLLPAHGPTAAGTHARVQELLDHHASRLAQAERAAAAGAGTSYVVAQTLTWTRRQHRLLDLDPFNQMLAVLETAAHLDVLVAQGRATSRTENGTTVYSA